MERSAAVLPDDQVETWLRHLRRGREELAGLGLERQRGRGETSATFTRRCRMRQILYIAAPTHEREFFSFALRRRGHALKCVSSASEGLAVLEVVTPDTVMLSGDLLGARDVARRLRELSSARRLILVGGSEKEAKALGAAGRVVASMPVAAMCKLVVGG